MRGFDPRPLSAFLPFLPFCVFLLVIKRFRQKRRDQETILAAFEEQGWPPRIDDPLPGREGLDRRRHLRDTTDNLNRHQQHRLIKFMGDGTGQGVPWDWHSGATVELL